MFQAEADLIAEYAAKHVFGPDLVCSRPPEEVTRNLPPVKQKNGRYVKVRTMTLFAARAVVKKKAEEHARAKAFTGHGNAEADETPPRSGGASSSVAAASTVVAKPVDKPTGTPQPRLSGDASSSAQAASTVVAEPVERPKDTPQLGGSSGSSTFQAPPTVASEKEVVAVVLPALPPLSPPPPPVEREVVPVPQVTDHGTGVQEVDLEESDDEMKVEWQAPVSPAPTSPFFVDESPEEVPTLPTALRVRSETDQQEVADAIAAMAGLPDDGGLASNASSVASTPRGQGQERPDHHKHTGLGCRADFACFGKDSLGDMILLDGWRTSRLANIASNGSSIVVVVVVVVVAERDLVVIVV